MAVMLTTPNTILGVLEPKTQTERLLSNVAFVLIGTLLLTISAKINVPVWPVPVTLQTFAVAAIAAAFGWRIGTATVIAYLIEGALGVPVFATGGGMAYLTGPSGGFLLGFIPMAAIIGYAADRGASGRLIPLAITMLLADVITLSLGFAWLLTIGAHASWLDQSNLVGSAFAKAVQPFLIWDALKMILAAVTVAGLFTLSKKRG